MLATRTLLGAALAILLVLPLDSVASPIQLHVLEVSIPPATVQARIELPDRTIVPQVFGEDGILLGAAFTAAFTAAPADLSHGGTVDIGRFALGNSYNGVYYLGPQNQAPLDGGFSFEIGQANQAGDGFRGRALDVAGTVQGTLYGPSAGEGVQLAGGFKGVATSASLYADSASARADLPSPLLDILNNPGHLHISGTVAGAASNNGTNYLDITLIFDPPSPVPVPEPTTLATLLAGAACLAARRSRLARRPR